MTRCSHSVGALSLRIGEAYNGPAQSSATRLPLPRPHRHTLRKAMSCAMLHHDSEPLLLCSKHYVRALDNVGVRFSGEDIPHRQRLNRIGLGAGRSESLFQGLLERATSFTATMTALDFPFHLVFFTITRYVLWHHRVPSFHASKPVLDVARLSCHNQPGLRMMCAPRCRQYTIGLPHLVSVSRLSYRCWTYGAHRLTPTR